MRQLVIALLCVACGIQSGIGAVIQVRPKLAGVYDERFFPVHDNEIVAVDPLSSVRLRPRVGSYLLQYDFLMTIEDLHPGQLGFGNTAFHIDLNGLTQSRDVPGWIPDGPPLVDVNGGFPRPYLPKWGDNLDAGERADDLKFILLGVAPKSFYTGNPPGSDTTTDPRWTLGMAPYDNLAASMIGDQVFPHTEGEYAGSIFVELVGTPGSTGQVGTRVLGGSTYNAELLLSTVGTIGGPPLAFDARVVPEPTTLVLAATSGALLLGIRRRGKRAHFAA